MSDVDSTKTEKSEPAWTGQIFRRESIKDGGVITLVEVLPHPEPGTRFVLLSANDERGPHTTMWQTDSLPEAERNFDMMCAMRRCRLFDD